TPWAYGASGWSPLAGHWRTAPTTSGTPVNLITGGLLTLGSGAGEDITVPGGTADLKVGGLSETAGSVISAAALRLPRAGAFPLGQANDVGILAADTSGGSVQFTAANSLTVGTVNGTAGISLGNNALVLNIGRDLTVDQPIDAGNATVIVNAGTAGPTLTDI